ncbi:MAG: L-2-amino-thiazoline-4-carboxylic acid hydrolase [bacterium]
MSNENHTGNSGKTAPGLTLLERRSIEAAIVGPLVRAFIDRFGEGPSLEVLSGVIEQLARAAGQDLATFLGEHSLEAFASTLDRWKAGGALELEILQEGPERLEFNVTRCRYAEMYRQLGLADLGKTLSCLRDFELAKGFNQEIELVRTQTIMEGAPFCDFRFRLKPKEAAEG